VLRAKPRQAFARRTGNRLSQARDPIRQEIAGGGAFREQVEVRAPLGRLFGARLNPGEVRLDVARRQSI
jgi:hypothetical protein